MTYLEQQIESLKPLLNEILALNYNATIESINDDDYAAVVINDLDGINKYTLRRDYHKNVIIQDLKYNRFMLDTHTRGRIYAEQEEIFKVKNIKVVTKKAIDNTIAYLKASKIALENEELRIKNVVSDKIAYCKNIALESGITAKVNIQSSETIKYTFESKYYTVTYTIYLNTGYMHTNESINTYGTDDSDRILSLLKAN